VIRLLTPLGLPYAEAVERYKPYDRIMVAQPQMRADTLKLVRHALMAQVSPYVLVNNRAEGCAPLTVQALAGSLA
jgi:hypothetical protein